MENLNRFYTYAYLREDRTPYYIGKGTGRRLYNKDKTEVRRPKDKSRIIYLKQNLTEEEAFKHEIYMISVFGRKDLRTGILRNKTDGGDGCSGYKHSAEVISKFRSKKLSEDHKKKLSAVKSGKNHHNYGKSLPEKTRKKISKSNTGKSHSQETKDKLSKFNKGKKLSQEIKNKISQSNKGRIVTQETRDKISKSQKGKIIPKEQILKMKEAQKGEKNHSSKLWKITFNDGSEITTWGLTGWAKENGYVYSSAYNVYTRKYKKHKDIVKVEVIS
jgi:hypothetical protein